MFRYVTVKEMIFLGVAVAACGVILTWLFTISLGPIIFGYTI